MLTRRAPASVDLETAQAGPCTRWAGKRALTFENGEGEGQHPHQGSAGHTDPRANVLHGGGKAESAAHSSQPGCTDTTYQAGFPPRQGHGRRDLPPGFPRGQPSRVTVRGFPRRCGAQEPMRGAQHRSTCPPRRGTQSHRQRDEATPRGTVCAEGQCRSAGTQELGRRRAANGTDFGRDTWHGLHGGPEPRSPGARAGPRTCGHLPLGLRAQEAPGPLQAAQLTCPFVKVTERPAGRREGLPGLGGGIAGFPRS